LSDSRSESRVDYTAQSAILVPGALGPKLVMLSGMAQVYDTRTGRLATMGFDDLTYDIGALIGPAGQGRNANEFSTSDLWSEDPSVLEQTGATLGEVRLELANRFAHPLLAIATAMIGFATLLASGFSRLGSWKPILAAVVLLAILQLLSNAMAGIAIDNARLWGLVFIPVFLGAATVWAILSYSTRRRRIAPDRDKGAVA
jgi:lipopolysaccharide export system permease protein